MSQRSEPAHAASVIETEQVHADSAAGMDHMGRKKVSSVAEAFRQDLPWMLGLVALVVFLIGAMSGYFR